MSDTSLAVCGSAAEQLALFLVWCDMAYEYMNLGQGESKKKLFVLFIAQWLHFNCFKAYQNFP